jgi:hypothetical protein
MKEQSLKDFILQAIILVAAIIAFVASKPEAGVLFLILNQLIIMTEKLGGKS